MRSVAVLLLVLPFAAAIIKQELLEERTLQSPASSVDICATAAAYVHLELDEQLHLHCSDETKPLLLRAYLFDVGHIDVSLQRFDNDVWLVSKQYRDDAVEHIRTKDAVVIHKVYHESELSRFTPLVVAYLIASAGCLLLYYLLDLGWIMRKISDV